MTAAQLVPGIQQYPDLEASLTARLPRPGGNCGKCDMGKLSVDYRAKLQQRIERDKMLRRP